MERRKQDNRGNYIYAQSNLKQFKCLIEESNASAVPK